MARSISPLASSCSYGPPCGSGESRADGLAAFCDICVRAFADFAVVKPQVAFFESYGA
ncbi:hypothetical protein GR255_21965, partial [Mycobacterium tuberculosis]|nr:hypothetical protein [Mycobacterium tuberculosis]